ncbi:ribonucleoside diphosphate reductase small subunit [Staphylococcus phage PG-2021_27]
MSLEKVIESKNKSDKLEPINWNNQSDGMSEIYWNQGVNQVWFPEEFDISRDLGSWDTLTETEKDTYKKVLAGLTGLDAKQGGEGMNLISYQEPRRHYKAVFGYMGMMEFVHERSYSHIFTTILTNKETNYLLDEWVKKEPHLVKKAQFIGYFYKRLLQPNPTTFDRYMAKVASAFLESALFYSGFYYPLLLAGQGRMTQSGAVIFKITQDESYHGSAVGLTAQYDYEMLSEKEQEKADKLTYELLNILYKNEVSYTHKLYDELGLSEDVIRYVEYNFNRALANLGKEDYFHPEPFNAIVENQTDVDRMRNVDFFSGKADYEKSTNVKDIQDSDFNFDTDKENETVDKFL